MKRFLDLNFFSFFLLVGLDDVFNLKVLLFEDHIDGILNIICNDLYKKYHKMRGKKLFVVYFILHLQDRLDRYQYLHGNTLF